MKDVLKTSFIENDKSSFLIELIKLKEGKFYIRLKQTIREEIENTSRILKINPDILENLIKELIDFKNLMPGFYKSDTDSNEIKPPIKLVNYKNERDKNLIISRYLKGISIKDLALQFDCDKSLIIQVLKTNEIEIVENIPKKKEDKIYKRGGRR